VHKFDLNAISSRKIVKLIFYEEIMTIGIVIA